MKENVWSNPSSTSRPFFAICLCPKFLQLWTSIESKVCFNRKIVDYIIFWFGLRNGKIINNARSVLTKLFRKSISLFNCLSNVINSSMVRIGNKSLLTSQMIESCCWGFWSDNLSFRNWSVAVWRSRMLSWMELLESWSSIYFSNKVLINRPLNYEWTDRYIDWLIYKDICDTNWDMRLLDKSQNYYSHIQDRIKILSNFQFFNLIWATANGEKRPTTWWRIASTHSCFKRFLSLAMPMIRRNWTP